MHTYTHISIYTLHTTYRQDYETLFHVLILSKHHHHTYIQIVGGTINLVKNTHFYGRYWGGFKFVQFLHFEACYYKVHIYVYIYIYIYIYVYI
jgi:predicted N-acyltransferase